jgi:hypothetical protein
MSHPNDSPTRAKHLRWEAKWIPVEIAGVVLCLFLANETESWDTWGFVLFGIVCFSLLVRWRHYAGR